MAVVTQPSSENMRRRPKTAPLHRSHRNSSQFVEPLKIATFDSQSKTSDEKITLNVDTNRGKRTTIFTDKSESTTEASCDSSATKDKVWKSSIVFLR